MTDDELAALEAAAKKMIETSCGPFASFYNEDFSKVILDLIAGLRQAQAERDWLAKQLATTGIFRTPYRRPMTAEQWLKLTKEAVCSKN